MPNGRFTYVVKHHRVVQPTAWWISHVGSTVPLSARDPLYPAAQGIVAFRRAARGLN